MFVVLVGCLGERYNADWLYSLGGGADSAESAHC